MPERVTLIPVAWVNWLTIFCVAWSRSGSFSRLHTVIGSLPLPPACPPFFEEQPATTSTIANSPASQMRSFTSLTPL